jgi:hypothetical protein
VDEPRVGQWRPAESGYGYRGHRDP